MELKPSTVYALIEVGERSVRRYCASREIAELWVGTVSRHRYEIEKRELYCVFAVVREDYGEEPTQIALCTTCKLAERERDAYLASLAATERKFVAEDVAILIYELVTQ